MKIIFRVEELQRSRVGAPRGRITKLTLLLRHSATLLFLIIALPGCMREVPPASVGIKFNASTGVSEKLVKPQVVWVGRWEQIIVYPTSIRNASYVRNANEGDRIGDDSIPASTSEGAILPCDVTIAYHVQSEDVVKAFQNFGSENLAQIQKQFIRWVAVYGVNVVSGKRSIFDLTSTDRAKFGREVKDVVSPMLGRWGITVDDVFIGEVHPHDEVRSKIQERIQVRNELELAKMALQRAKIDAQTILTNAQREAEQNRLLAGQGANVLELKRLELQRLAIEKWDGRPPKIGDGRIPFTSLNLR
jgi:regulator of protease activity HflC (stomatin/prohibitin superfamily)